MCGTLKLDSMAIRTVLLAFLLAALGPLSAGELEQPRSAEAEAIARHLEEQTLRLQLERATENRYAAELAYESFRRRVDPKPTAAELSQQALAEIRARLGATGTASKTRSPAPAFEPSTAFLVRKGAIDRVFEALRGDVGGCCYCNSLLNCDDGTFCNGAEMCGPDFTCLPGSPPCNDGDSCTVDQCLEGSQSCQNDPLPVPEEVMSLAVEPDVADPFGATLFWTEANNATAYNVYRGAMSDLGDLSCLAPSVAITSYDDPNVPAVLFLYLVSSVGCRESGLGDDSSGPRSEPPGCP